MKDTGLSNVVRLVVAMGVAYVAWMYLFPPKPLPDEPEPPAKMPNVTREQAAAVGSPAILAGDPFAKLSPGRPPKPAAVAKPVAAPTEPPTLIALGDDSFALKALLTTRGAGVQQLILSNFREADRIGRPSIDPETKQKRPLHLIPGFTRVQYLSLKDENDYPALSANLTAAGFAAGAKPGKLANADRLAAPSYVMLHYPAKDDPIRALDKEGKPIPEDDKYPLATLAEQDWKVVSLKQPPEPEGVWEVVFETDLAAPYHLRLRKTFRLARGDYDFQLKVEIEPLPGRIKGAGKFRYQIAGPVGMPLEGEWYTTSFRTAYFGWLDGTGTPRREIDDAGNIHYRYGGDGVVKPGRFSYAAIGTQYFASALAVDDATTDSDQPWEYVRPTRTPPPPAAPGDTGPIRQPYEQERYFLFDIGFRAVSRVFDPVAGETLTHNYAVYNGPMKVRLLRELTGAQAVPPETVDRYLTKYHLETLTDYHSPTWFGRRLDGLGWSGLIIWTTNIMHWLLGTLHALLGSWGAAIIGVTICVRLCLFYPSRRQQTINAHMSAKIAALKPQIDKLNEKHKDDFLAQTKARSELFKQAGIRQTAQLGGCLLLLMQMPFLMGLYFCLQESTFFRLESFLWFPSLAAPDMLAWWSESVPVISSPSSRFGAMSFLYLGPFFNIMPLAAVVLMYITQKMVMPPPTDEIQAQQQAIMKYMFVFTALFFYKVAAGLCLYFIVGSVWALLERRLVPKPDLTKAQAAATAAQNAGDTIANAKTGAPPAPPADPEKPQGFWGRMKTALEEAQRKAEADRQIRNDRPNGAPPAPPRPSAGDRAQDRKNKKKRK
jgi:YidC/Oxa1 family membrane protein insertase